MKCADLEGLICEYVEGTLAEQERTLVERHLASCPSCAEIVQDASAGLSVLRAASRLEPPSQLVNRILFEITTRQAAPKPMRAGPVGWLTAWLGPLLQPRLAMGMAMTVLSFSMLARFAGLGPRQLSTAELNPIRLWRTLDDAAHRTWERARKFYLSLRIVYEIQTQLHEWSQQLREEGAAAGAAPWEQRETAPAVGAAEPGSFRPDARPRMRRGEPQP